MESSVGSTSRQVRQFAAKRNSTIKGSEEDLSREIAQRYADRTDRGRMIPTEIYSFRIAIHAYLE